MWRNRSDKPRNETEIGPAEEADWLREVEILDSEKALLTVRTRSGKTVLYQVPTKPLLPSRLDGNDNSTDRANGDI